MSNDSPSSENTGGLPATEAYVDESAIKAHYRNMDGMSWGVAKHNEAERAAWVNGRTERQRNETDLSR